MSDKLGLSADEVLTTTRSVRKRLDLTRPVEREVLMECIDIAHQAPTGSNMQGWRWLFIDDPVKKKALADMYRANYYPYVNDPTVPSAMLKVSASSIHQCTSPASWKKFPCS